MRDWLLIAALERRYDGPIPPLAGVPADHAAPWPEQLLNRRRLAWCEVRRIGNRLVRASRALRSTPAAHHYQEWRRLRHELAFALQTWKSYRDWTGDMARTLPDITSSPHSDRRPPIP